MKKTLFSLLLYAVLFTTAAGQGFNLGQMPKFALLRFDSDGMISDEFVEKIKEVVPTERLQYVRFSGTLSNYMNIDFPGFGSAPAAEAENMSFKKRPVKSYVSTLTMTANQLGAEYVTFAFNSHEPYLGRHELQNSMRSLQYVNENTRLIAIELENETWMSDEILGFTGTPNLIQKLILVLKGVDISEKGIRTRINKCLDYLEQEVVPAIRKAGYTQPLGISVHVTDNITSRCWNQEVARRNFYQFVTPHLYVKGTDEKSVRDTFRKSINEAGQRKGVEIRITEYGVDGSVKSGFSTMEDAEKFIRLFNKIAAEYGIRHTYFHTLWANGTDGKGRPVNNHFSYLKGW